MNYLEGLNEAQKTAVTHINGPLLIVAGAGAGKTKTITHRIVHLINNGIRPDQILAITFTNKAAKEMRERAEKIINQNIENVVGLPTLLTFHSFCVRILKEQHSVLGLKKHFVILDEGDAVSMIKDAIKSIDLDPKQYEPKKIKGIISRAKSNMTTREVFTERATSTIESIVARVWALYEKSCKEEGAVDFDDLLLETVLLFEKHPDILEMYQDRYKYIHIDEYQDTNEVQYRLATLLAKKYKNICVVGDSDQTIYTWRGANIKNILQFEEDYPNALVVLLEENYRSTKNIITAANNVIIKNKERKDKTLFTNKDAGEAIGVYQVYDEKVESSFVATQCLQLIDEGVSPDDIAVLYRANFQSRAIEEAMLEHHVPYTVLGTRFFDRKEVKDVLSYLRAAQNPDSLSDVKRIINFPARGIGKTTLVKLFSGMRDQLPPAMQKKIESFYNLLATINAYATINPPSEVLRYIVQTTGIETELKAGSSEDIERLENIKELVTLAQKYDEYPIEEGLDHLLSDASLMSDQDTLTHNEGKKGVRMMTIHASKGLEFPYVFIVGLEHGLFPHQRDGRSSEADKEEERRLFYVALTRAEKKLYLTHAELRTIFGMRQINSPSEFLFDIPEEIIETEHIHGQRDKVIYFEAF
ncbi:MAG: ATP-dependent helicase [Minisyncoccia bacterium]